MFHNASTYAESRCIPCIRRPLTYRLQTHSNRLHRAHLSSTPAEGKKSSSTGPISWKSLLVFAIAGGGVWYYVRYLKEEKEKGNFEVCSLHSIVLFRSSLKKCYDLDDDYFS